MNNMIQPAFREPIFKIPTDEGEVYRPPTVSRAKLAEIKEEMQARQVPITAGNIQHALEADEIREFLDRHDIEPYRAVSASRDRKGVVRITFDEFRRLVNALQAEGWRDYVIEPEQSQDD